jgi:phospholipase/carboxylesterase
MLSRRALLLAGLSAPVAAAPVGCSRPKPAASGPRRREVEGVELLSLFPNGADESSPLVVAIHGRGDAPDHWVDTWSRFPPRAEVALPRGFDRWGQGWAWFEFRDGMTDEQFGAEVGAAEERLWRAVAKLARGRRLVVTGFSQGGFFAYAMPVRHPTEIAAGFPVGGSCPGPLLPKNGARAAPIVAFHGTEDTVLDIKWARGAVNAFREQGDEAVLREYPGVGHTITPEMQRDLWAEIARVIV